MTVFDKRLSESIDRVRQHQDGLFLLGAAVNLYGEAMRRQRDRILYGPQDIENILKIADILLSIEGPGHVELTRPAHATEEEAAQINDPFNQLEILADQIDTGRAQG